MSSVWTSNDNEDPEKDEAIMFFEGELSRSRDKLEGPHCLPEWCL